MDRKFYNYMTNVNTSLGVTKFEYQNAQRDNIYEKISKMKSMHSDKTSASIRKYLFGPDDLEIDNQFLAEYQVIKEKICESIHKQLHQQNKALSLLNTPRTEKEKLYDSEEPIPTGSKSLKGRRQKLQPPKKNKSKLQKAFYILNEDIKSTDSAKSGGSKDGYKKKLDDIMNEFFPIFFNDENDNTQITLGDNPLSILQKISKNFETTQYNIDSKLDMEETMMVTSTKKTKNRNSANSVLDRTDKQTPRDCSLNVTTNGSSINILGKDKNQPTSPQLTMANDTIAFEKNDLQENLIENRKMNSTIADIEEHLNKSPLKSSKKNTHVNFDLDRQVTKKEELENISTQQSKNTNSKSKFASPLQTENNLIEEDDIINKTIHEDNYPYIVKKTPQDFGLHEFDIDIQENTNNKKLMRNNTLNLNFEKDQNQTYDDDNNFGEVDSTVNSVDRLVTNVEIEGHSPENLEKKDRYNGNILPSINSHGNSRLESDLDKCIENENSAENSGMITYDNSASGRDFRNPSTDYINTQESKGQKKIAAQEIGPSINSDSNSRNIADNNSSSFSRKNSDNALRKDIYNTFDKPNLGNLAKNGLVQENTTQNLTPLKDVTEIESNDTPENIEIDMNVNNINIGSTKTNLGSTFPTINQRNQDINFTTVKTICEELDTKTEFMYHGVEYFAEKDRRTQNFKERLTSKLPKLDPKYFTPQFRIRPKTLDHNTPGQVIISKRLNGIKMDYVDNNIMRNPTKPKKKGLTLRYMKSVFPDPHNFKIYPYESEDKKMGVCYEPNQYSNTASKTISRNRSKLTENQPSLKVHKRNKTVNLKPHKLRDTNVELTPDEKEEYEQRINLIDEQSAEKQAKMTRINKLGKEYQDFKRLKNVQNAIVFKSYLDDYQTELKKKMYPLLQECQKSINITTENRTLVQNIGKDEQKRYLIERFNIFELDKKIPDTTLDVASKVNTIKVDENYKNSPPPIGGDNAHDYLKWLNIIQDKKLQHSFLKFITNNHLVDKAYVDNMDQKTLVGVNKEFPKIGKNFHPDVIFEKLIENGRHLITKETMKEFVVGFRIEEAKKDLLKDGLYKPEQDIKRKGVSNRKIKTN